MLKSSTKLLNLQLKYQPLTLQQSLSYLCLKGRTINYQYYAIRLLITLLLVSVVGVFLPKPLYAHNLSVAYQQADQYINVLDQAIAIKPTGNTVNLTIDLSEKWQFSADSQQQQGDDNYQDKATMSVDLSKYGIGLSYFNEQFSYGVYYSYSKDHSEVIGLKNSHNKQQESNKVNLLSANVDYSWGEQQWFYSASFNALYNQFSSDIFQSKLTLDRQKQQLVLEELQQQNSGFYAMLSASLSATYSWDFSDNKNMFLGGVFSWNYQFADDIEANLQSTLRLRRAATRNRTYTRTSSGLLNTALSGDDNYGQWVIYSSYSFTKNWSLDVDFSKNIATTNNEQALSVGLSYSF